MPRIIVKLGDTIVQEYSFDKSIINVGRSRDNDITIDNLAVSRSHCRIRNMDGKYIITDLNSANGTYVNGVKITKTEVINEDIVSVGKHKMVFSLEEINREEAIGEAFSADRTMIQEQTAEGVLEIVKGKNKGEKFKITKYETKIGRGSDNDIVLNDWFVSKNHAKIIRTGGDFVIKDVGSWKGTHLNEKPLKEARALKEGDELRIGSTRISFSVFDENKQLQLEMRRPEELGYTAPPAGSVPEDAAHSPEDLAREDAKNRAAEKLPTMQIDADMLPDIDNLTPPEIPDGPPRTLPKNPELIDDVDLDFENLPDPSFTPPPSPVERDGDTDSSAGLKQTVDALFNGAGDDAPPLQWREFDIYGEGSGTGWGASPEEIRQFEQVQRQQAEKKRAAMPTVESAQVPANPAKSAPQKSERDEGTSGKMDASEQVAMWERALQNKSPIIRKQAAKMLKKLTGKDYDIEQ